MSWQPVFDLLVTIFVLFAIFFLGYCAIRKQGIKETYYEIKELIEGKAEEIKSLENMKYAN